MNPARALIVLGAILIVAGLLWQFVPALRPGRLPGDLAFGNGNVRVYIPIATSLVLSVVLTLLAALFFRR